MSSSVMMNGTARQNGRPVSIGKVQDEILQLNLEMKNPKNDEKYAIYHGDKLIGDAVAPSGFMANLENSLDDFRRIITFKNLPAIGTVLKKLLSGGSLDVHGAASLVGSMSNDSNRRRALIEGQVKTKYDKMLHPPLTYLGDAFQYRQADGKFNNVLSPHLGQAGAPYAKTVPSKTHPLGALPDPGDLFDRLLAREEKGRNSESGLSAMLIYHATLIIHDIFRTNDKDKNISDSSSYLDLSPLYGYTMEMQRKVRDGSYKLGLLKPDTFAEDRLLRQPPGVCIMLVMYNRYHNYAATQLRRINENGRFSVPDKYLGTELEALARQFPKQPLHKDFNEACANYNKAWKNHDAKAPPYAKDRIKLADELQEIEKLDLDNDEKENQQQVLRDAAKSKDDQAVKDYKAASDPDLERCEKALEACIGGSLTAGTRKAFKAGYDAAWVKLDDDLFNTARLITCGLYIQVAIHDYLRALMGFHQFNTNLTYEPRMDINHRSVSRGLGNQVTVEFNLLYRFHCAITQKDEAYTEDFMKETLKFKDPKNVNLDQFVATMAAAAGWTKEHTVEPCDITFGLKHKPKHPTKVLAQEGGSESVSKEEQKDKKVHFERNPVTGLFDDQQMIDALASAMDDPISNFGPRNIPRCLKSVEIMGIMQARKWQVGTLNDFREFFQMPRHQTFESVTGNVDIQNALRDLYDHPDKIELYPGVFCESDENMGLDPGPSGVDSALWAAIFSDAITLVRSDRFYTIDWNTNSLTSWGMREVTEDNDICKSSVFHRLLQRAFPGWFPYDSVRFFHPFYTSQQNARFAQEQGYGADFKFKAKGRNKLGNPTYDVTSSMPHKPRKPVYLTDFERISDVLNDKTGAVVHPGLRDLANFPTAIRKALEARKSVRTVMRSGNPTELIKEDTPAILDYFKNMMRHIVKRESITMNERTYQIDATRDFAIPVTTRYVADFLGFGHLIRDEKTPKAPYSENEIYQHITNCQIFLSYNADETKLLKRRKAFTSSLQFLYKLAMNGNILEAGRWPLAAVLFGRKSDNAMTELGFKVALHVLEHEKDQEKAAGILVFVGLHTAYNSVLAFSSVLSLYMKEMYEYANSKPTPLVKPVWLKVQELAFREDESSFEELMELVLTAERKSIKLPVIRTATKDCEFDKGTWRVKEGDTIILDIHRANDAVFEANVKATEVAKETGAIPKLSEFLDHKTSITEQLADYEPKKLALMSVTAMIRTIAQMRNPRRGHDAQGHLKKVNLDASAEGYSNFMAPMRMARIAQQVKMADDQDTDKTYTDQILRPATETYLTAEWDEFVPFPNTWKIRFDGFGKSNYKDSTKGPGELASLIQPKINVDALAAPPFYQPKGASAFGGSFADVACVCNQSGTQCHCKDAKEKKEEAETTSQKQQAGHELPISVGCGIGK